MKERSTIRLEMMEESTIRLEMGGVHNRARDGEESTVGLEMGRSPCTVGQEMKEESTFRLERGENSTVYTVRSCKCRTIQQPKESTGMLEMKE